jgi:hypothetical protein
MHIVNLYSGETGDTDATVLWDIENINIPSRKDVAFVYKKLLYLNDKYKLDIDDIIVVGNPSNIKLEHLDAFEKYRFEYIPVDGLMKNEADVKIKEKIDNIKKRINLRHVIILITSDEDFVKTLNKLRENPLYKSILIHSDSSKPALLDSTDIAINWKDFIEYPDPVDTNPNYECIIHFYVSDIYEKFIVSGSLDLRLYNIVQVKSYNEPGQVAMVSILPMNLINSKPHDIMILARNQHEYKQL